MAMLLRRLIAVSITIASIVTAVGCGKPETIPTPVEKTDEFSGTVTKGGTSDNTFSVSYELALTPATVTVKSLVSSATGTPLTVTIGLAVGSMNGGVCTPHPLSTATAATVGQAQRTPDSFLQGPSQYCVRIFDNGTLTDSANYVVTVLHY
jgi:hypothetical protein